MKYTVKAFDSSKKNRTHCVEFFNSLSGARAAMKKFTCYSEMYEGKSESFLDTPIACCEGDGKIKNI